MSAAATAAGYLYASGRLRGRSKDEAHEKREETPAPAKRRIRVAAIHEHQVRHAPVPQVREHVPAPRVRPAPRVEYRVRRWRPE
jgi:hypothetical protein